MVRLPRVNAFVFNGATHGLVVAAGDLDLDGLAEIAAGPGPDPLFASELRGLEYDGTSLATIAALSQDPFGLTHGLRVSCGALGY